MDGIGAEVSQKIRSAIKAKLMELGVYVDDELPDYIMVMVANKRSHEQMEDDLQLFLGTNTAEFTNWLHQVLQKLQEVTVANMERKRKSANDSESESIKKDKHKKSVEKKKLKKSSEQAKGKGTETAKQHAGKQSEESAQRQNEKTNEACSEPVKTQIIVRRINAGKVNESSSDTKQNEKATADRPKIVLMQSDDDDDEDFINIKADAEAEALLDAELPKEAQDSNVTEPTVTETKQDDQSVHVSDRLKVKVSTESVLNRLGTRKVTSVPHESHKHVSPLLRVSDHIGDKMTDRLGVRKVALRSEGAADDEKILSRLGEKVNLSGEMLNVSVAHVSPTSVNRQSKLLIVKSNTESKTLGRQLEGDDSKEQRPRKRPLLSRVVAMNKEPRAKEEEEYDPTNPAVGSVASVVRVKPRPKVPAALQANKNLILKAMAEAQKSVASAPKRVEPEERVDGLFTKKFRDSKGRDKIAITLPNRRMQPQDKIQIDEKPSDIDRIVIPVKLEAARSISTVNLQQKIVIQVSSEKTHETADSEISKYEELPEEEVDDIGIKLIEVVPEVETEELKDEGFEEIQRVISCGSQDLELEAEESVENISEIPISLPDVQRTESPQFVVTLDGLDPTIFNVQKKQKPATIIVSGSSPGVQYEEKEKEQIELEESKTKKPASPILFVKAASPDTSGTPSDASKQKINERCKYWPACRLGDKCDYLHPTVSCKSFPNCKFGEKCLYIHPNCKFDASCTRRDCPFTHASPRNMASGASVIPLRTSQQVCKFYPKCSNVNCKFLHPKMCRYGRYCNRKTECTYRHEEIPPADKLKWICPFRV